MRVPVPARHGATARAPRGARALLEKQTLDEAALRSLSADLRRGPG
jgi:hypothetical protein